MTTRTISALPSSISRPSGERGVALILTLAILVMVTLLVIAFAISMRVENAASKNFNDLLKARQLAQAAVDQAIATIRSAAPVASVVTNYVTAPGVIYTEVAGTWVTHPLFTSIDTVANTGSVDLNQNNLITGIGVDFTAGSSPLWVGWSNVTANGTSEKMRFAYWVDDESAKVNLNVAGTRGNDLEGYTPAAIDLEGLHFASLDQKNITNYVSTIRSLDTIESIKMTTPPLATVAPGVTPTVYSNNQFYITVNSTSPDVTPWGDKRLNLNAVVSNNFLYPTTSSQIIAITNILANANLTTWFGKTFATKYTNLAQIAANIIDYIDTNNVPTDSGTPLDITLPAYLGLEQTPYLNEIAISNALTAVADPATPGSFDITPSTGDIAELWYMYTGIDWTPPVGTTEIILLNRPTITITPVPPATVNGAASVTLTLPATGTISANGGITRLAPYGIFPTAAPEAPVPSVGALPIAMTTNLATIVFNSGTVTAIFRNQTSGRFDYAVIPLTNYTLNYNAQLAPLTNVIWASACNDPRVKPVSNNWVPVGAGMANAMTLGGPNTGVLNQNVVTAPGITGDGDISCHTNSGSRGLMYPGELSFIHTGYPWRTFWLQTPAIAEAGMIPDWVVLDLFSATDATNVIGRLNINSILTNSSPGSIDRALTLNALLTNNLPSVPSYSLATAVTNAYFYQYGSAPGPGYVNPPPSGFSPAYTMIGEVANTKGLANLAAGSAKRDRETPVRGIANIVTTKSDTFTVWAVAQVGNGNRPAEAKVQAIVQRTVDYTTTPPQVRFRTLYYRYLYN